MPSEVEEIEAIIREELDWPAERDPDGAVAASLSRIGSRIAAIRSKDREDGAREMALPPGWVAVPQAPTRAMCAEMARIVGNGDIAHFAYERALAARPALPLTTRTGMRRLTDLEARTIRWLRGVSGTVVVPDPAMITTIYDLMSDGLVAIMVSSEGRRALAEYDRPRADPHGYRLVSGMSEAGRAALAKQEGTDGE